MQQSSGLRLSPIDSFPLGDGNFPRPVPTAAARKSVLQHSCLMIEEMLILGALRADLKSKFALLKCPIRHRLFSWEWSSGGPWAPHLGIVRLTRSVDVTGKLTPNSGHGGCQVKSRNPESALRSRRKSRAASANVGEGFYRDV